jgi:hypothetical protein
MHFYPTHMLEAGNKQKVEYIWMEMVRHIELRKGQKLEVVKLDYSSNREGFECYISGELITNNHEREKGYQLWLELNNDGI